MTATAARWARLMAAALRRPPRRADLDAADVRAHLRALALEAGRRRMPAPRTPPR